MNKDHAQLSCASVTRVLAVAGTCVAVVACAAQGPRVAVQQPASRVAIPPAPPAGEPADLAGLKAGQLVLALGPPAFVRKDGVIETWRYDAPECKAFFFLYPYGTALLVRHVETVPRGHEMAADPKCLDSLRPRPATPVS
jgi:hypothetical protein